MFDPIKQFFAPKPGDVRIRDVVREVPGAAFNVGTELVQSTARGFDLAARKLIGNEDDVTKYADTQFTEAIFGGNEKRFTGFGSAVEKEFGLSEAKHPVLAPVLGAAMVAADVTGGHGKKAKTAAGGFKTLSGKIIKQIDEPTKAELRAIKSYLANSADKLQDTNKAMEETFFKLSDKFEIPDTSWQKQVKYIDKLLEETKTVEGLPGAKKIPVNLQSVKEASVSSRARRAGTEKAVEYTRKNILKGSDLINTDRMQLSKGARQMLDEEVESFRPLIENGRRMTNAELRQAVDTKGRVLRQVMGNERAEQMSLDMLATRDDFVAKLDRAAELARVGDKTAGEAHAEAFKAFAVARSHLSNAGYQLQSAAITAKPSEASPLMELAKDLMKKGHDLDAIYDAMKKVDPNDFNQVAEFYRAFEPAQLKEWVDLIRYNSMLSGPLTYLVNIISTAGNAVLVRPLTKVAAGGIDFLAHPLDVTARKQLVSEVGPYALGFIESLGKASKKFGKVMSGRGQWTNLDLKKSIPLATQGSKSKAAKFLSFPMKVLEATDQFFMELITGAEMRALVYRSTKGAVAPKNIKKAAKEVAQYTAYRQDLFSSGQNVVLDAVDRTIQGIEGFRFSKNPLVAWPVKLTIPFLRTPMNIVKQGIEYSPFGVATAFGKGVNTTEQLGKALIGTGIGLGAVNMALAGRLTFQEPTNENERNAWRKAGRQPMSVRIGDKWVSYEKLPPALGWPLALVAATTQRVKDQTIDETTAEAVLAGLAKAQAFYADQSYFKGLSELIGAVTGGGEGGSTGSVERLVSNVPQQFIPLRAMSGWIARMLDDTQRTVDDKATYAERQLQLLFLNIPGVREQQPAKKDKFGNPIPALNPVRNALTPVKVTDVQKNFEDFLADYDTYSKVSSDAARASRDLSEKAQETYDAFKKMDPEEAKQAHAKLFKENEELAQKVLELGKERMTGITPEESMIKSLRVQARAEYIDDKLKNTEDQRERQDLLKHYEKIGILTRAVAEEMVKLNQ